MDTATEREEPGGERFLMDRPQRFGILPTRWWWRQPASRRLLVWVFPPLTLAALLLGAQLGVHPIATAAILLVVLTIAEGLLEKYIRRQAMRRRALVASAATDELPQRAEGTQPSARPSGALSRPPA